MQRRWESQISSSLPRKNNNLPRASRFLYISLPSTVRLPVKMPNFTFCEERKQAMTKFILFMNLDIVDRNSAPEELACIWQSKQVGIITITETEKTKNSLFYATFSLLSAIVVSFKNSLQIYLRKTWPMQAWIPVVSWSLYFWKSVFSFRADSSLKSDGGLYQTESFLTACILVHEPDKPWSRQ